MMNLLLGGIFLLYAYMIYKLYSDIFAQKCIFFHRIFRCYFLTFSNALIGSYHLVLQNIVCWYLPALSFGNAKIPCSYYGFSQNFVSVLAVRLKAPSFQFFLRFPHPTHQLLYCKESYNCIIYQLKSKKQTAYCYIHEFL